MPAGSVQRCMLLHKAGLAAAVGNATFDVASRLNRSISNRSSNGQHTPIVTETGLLPKDLASADNLLRTWTLIWKYQDFGMLEVRHDCVILGRS